MKPDIPKVLLRRGKAGSAIGRHPWLYAGMIAHVEGQPQDGSAVSVVKEEDGSFVAHGIFNSKSEIRVRLYSWDADAGLEDALFRARIRDAVHLRRELGLFREMDGACRLICSEGDAFSGLTVDRYGSYAVAQITSLAVAQRFEQWADELLALASVRGIYARTPADAEKKEGIIGGDRIIAGEVPDGIFEVAVAGLRMGVSLRGGQKTGLYLDQRDNYLAASAYASGRSLLDLYCYTGGFSLHCAKEGAQTLGIDSSSPALEQAKSNATLNGVTASFERADVLEYLAGVEPGRYSMVVIDPPRLATSRQDKERALRMYFHIHREVLRRIATGGICVACSCSGRVSREEFISTFASAAKKAGRFLQILEVRGASRDHPYNPYCPESEYLKCVIARVT